MNRIKSLIAISAFSLAVLVLPAVVSAQWYPNGGTYGRNNQYRDLRAVADRLKDRSRDFEDRVDNVVDRRDDRRDDRRGGWGNRGGYQNYDLKQLAGDFRRAAEHFEDKYGNGRNLRNSEDAARRLLDAASRVDNAIYSTRLNNRAMSQWNSMRNDISLIANTYGYNYNNRGRNNRNNRSGDWRNRIPFPLPF